MLTKCVHEDDAADLVLNSLLLSVEEHEPGIAALKTSRLKHVIISAFD